MFYSLEEKGYKGFTLKELTNKIKKLWQKYKQQKDKSWQTGNGASKKWKYFEEIDVFLSKRHNVNPPAVVDTMAETNMQKFDDGELRDLEGDSSTQGLLKVSNIQNCSILIYTLTRDITTTLIGWVYTHIFMFCLTSFFSN